MPPKTGSAKFTPQVSNASIIAPFQLRLLPPGAAPTTARVSLPFAVVPAAAPMPSGVAAIHDSLLPAAGANNAGCCASQRL